MVKLDARKEEEPPHERIMGETEASPKEVKVEDACAIHRHRKSLYRKGDVILEVRWERPLRLQLLDIPFRNYGAGPLADEDLDTGLRLGGGAGAFCFRLFYAFLVA